ncbi:MAG: PAS domain S-box protein [Sterolibacterium sp.]
MRAEWAKAASLNRFFPANVTILSQPSILDPRFSAGWRLWAGKVTMPLDVFTLMQLMIVLSAVLGTAIALTARGEGSQYLRLWSAAMFLHGFAYIGFLMRGHAPDWFSIVLANVVLSIAFALVTVAMARFNQTTVSPWLVWGPALLVLALFPLILDSQLLRNAASSLIHGGQLLLILYILECRGTPVRGRGQQLLAGGLALMAGLLLLRLLTTLVFGGPAPSVNTQHPWQAAIFLGAMISLLLAGLGFILMVRDHAENLARDSKHVLATIFDSAEESIAMFRRDGTLLAINRKGAERFHTTPQKMIGWHMTDAMPPEVSGPRIAAIQRVADTGMAESQVDQRAGRMFRIMYYPVQGEKERVVTYGTDITETRAAEEALRRSEAHFRAFFERSMVGMATTNPDKGWIEINDALCEMLGYTRETLMTKAWAELTHPDDLDAEIAQFNRVVAGDIEEYALDKRFIRKDGALADTYVASRCVRLPDSRIDYFVMLVEDISERKSREQELKATLAQQRELNAKLEQAQNQLLQSEKMASIGQLAAGVAHELNNPIGFVHSNLGTLEGYLQDIFAIAAAYETVEKGPCLGCAHLDAARALKREKDFDYLKTDIVQLMAESRDGLSRVAKIVRDLKNFSRAGEAELQWADLHQGLDSTLNIVWNELKYKCTVNKAYGELPPVWCVPAQLNQVFMNLLVNAGHAIPEKGEVGIRTGRQGDEVFVAISDTGIGIPPENMHRLFEPFFTTKPVGKGTGLGLSLAYSIVKKHRGRIDVHSELGKGSTFTVWLPVQQSDATA